MEEIRRQIDAFLTGPMANALRMVEYQAAGYGDDTIRSEHAAKADVSVSHVLGSPEASYKLRAYGETLLMQIQLNVYRLVVIYTLPVAGATDAAAIEPRLTRWQIGAVHAGWRIGWRDTVDVESTNLRRVELYCYAMLPEDFLGSDRDQLYWINDTLQMTRSLMLEARRIQLPLNVAA